MTGIDAARGLALIGLISLQILPEYVDATQESTWSHLFSSGDAVALFVLLAGVGLALSSGGRFPHEGRWLAADRAGVAVRAGLIAVVGLGIGATLPADVPADNLLIYYAVLLLLAIPFLHLSATALFVCAAVSWIVGPLLMQGLMDVLPAYSPSNATFANGVGEPAGTIAPLLLTGTYPAMEYLTYLLVGLGLGRVHLRDTGIQGGLLTVGAGLVIFAQTTSAFVSYASGGDDRSLITGGMGENELAEVLLRGPDSWPTDTAWWLSITTAHTNPLWEIATSLGVGLLVLGSFLLVSQQFGAWLLPLSAMGAMILTLYTAHLVALSFQAPYDQPHLWYVIHVVVAALLAVAWQRALGQGPLERVLSTSVETTRRTVLHRPHRPHWIHRM
ncbi:heparan-alpha-glucosaminide N-acetyltransferase domain-containing protein [Kocuria rosea]|uniref:heparan-alpha-glucosaminide N-acetyltransferase domain-containing protein n=1 Tax=Kocuria rosea TaxID=1275 RepID=UPI00203BD1C3|nr:DUF1624 domain-containing protein [Kocuria rosea]